MSTTWKTPRSKTRSDGGRSLVATRRRHSEERLLIIDASLSNKLASRLRERGRAAQALSEFGWQRLKDPEVLRAVFSEYPEAVLVAYDDAMPRDHDPVVKEVKATLAIVEPWDRRPRKPLILPPDMSPDEAWKREVVQRWAHGMATQAGQSIRRYSREGSAAWTPKIRNPQGRLFK